jgi:hypothetical protein
MSRTAPPRINVTIDRLVLRGFAPEQRDGIAQGLEAELRRQLGDPTQAALFAHSRSDAVLRAGTVRGRHDAHAIGAAAARRIADGLPSRRPINVVRAK